MHYVYVLENAQGRHYIGSCENIELRLRRHNQNSVRSTKGKGPLKLVCTEEFNTRTEVRKRENQLKSYKNSVYTTPLENPALKGGDEGGFSIPPLGTPGFSPGGLHFG